MPRLIQILLWYKEITQVFCQIISEYGCCQTSWSFNILFMMQKLSRPNVAFFNFKLLCNVPTYPNFAVLSLHSPKFLHTPTFISLAFVLVPLFNFLCFYIHMLFLFLIIFFFLHFSSWASKLISFKLIPNAILFSSPRCVSRFLFDFSSVLFSLSLVMQRLSFVAMLRFFFFFYLFIFFSF